MTTFPISQNPIVERSNDGLPILKVLIACEYSGTVRDAFLALGHFAVSCDLLPTDIPGPHYQGDVSRILHQPWDLIIAHPPCTYLCNSGVRWLYEQGTTTPVPDRWTAMREGAEFFKLFLNHPCPHIAIENPIMHGHAKAIIGKDFTQSVQPYEYGHGETKRTCLWLKGLPSLKPTNIVSGRIAAVHMAPPSEDRWKIRSKTYEGIASAMASQWSEYLCKIKSLSSRD